MKTITQPLKLQLLLICMFVYAIGFSQPTQVKDIDTYCCLGGSNPSGLFTHNGLIYFTARDFAGTNTPGGTDLGYELWISDGTTEGTILLKDINSGSANGGPNSFFVYNNLLYFTANSGSGNVLFTTDGTEMGTIPVSGVGEVFYPVFHNGLIYHINNEDRRLYQFNGTTSVPVSGSGIEYIQGDQLVVLNNKIYCYMNTSSDIGTYGTELYAYNLTTQSFELIKNIAGGQLESELSYMTLLGSEIYFSTFSESELWKTDGTQAGTVAVAATSSIYSFINLFSWNDELYFEGDDDETGDQLWKYNPLSDTLINLSNLSGGSNHDPSDYVELDGWLYYSGEDSNDNEAHLWRTQGTIAFGTGTYQLDDTITDVRDIVVLNGKLYFRGNNGTDGNELFEFDPATLSIDAFSKDQVIIHPNPSSNTIYVSSASNDIQSIELFNLLGEQILKISNTNQVEVNHYETGIYLVKIVTSKGQITKKVVVKSY